MNGLPYYKAYPRDFVEGTIGMPFELKAAYRLALDLIYMQGGKLPDDARYIAGLLGCSTKAWNGYRAKLIEMGKLRSEDGVLRNHRADAELETLAKLSDVQREKRLGKSKNKDLPEPQFHQPEPEPEPEEEGATAPCPTPSAPDGASEQPVASEPLPKPKARRPTAERFEEFWHNAYPHGSEKVGKAKCLAKYQAFVRDGVDEQAVIDGARRYRRSEKVQRGFVKLPLTWLNGRHWEDEIAPAANVVPLTAKGRTNGLAEGFLSAIRGQGMADGPSADDVRPLLPARH